MKQCSALVLIFSAIGFATAQENNSTDKVLGTRHILRFATSNFDNVQEKFREKGFNNENQSQGIMNKFNELVPPDAKLAGKIHDLPQNATSQQFFEALKKIENEIKPADELIIYISSHGCEFVKDSKYRQGDTDQGETLYIATNEPIENWVPMIEITKYLSKTKFRLSKKLVVANCSRKYQSRETGFATIGKNWENNDQTDEYNSERQLISNRRKLALEEGKTEVDMNMAIMFSCGSGCEAYNNRASRQGLFENALYEILSEGPSGYKSVDALFEKVKTQTDLAAIRTIGVGQDAELVVFAADAESASAIARMWKVGHSENAETVRGADEKQTIIPRTIYDAVGIDVAKIETDNFLKTNNFEITLNNLEKSLPSDGSRLRNAAIIADKIAGIANFVNAVGGSNNIGPWAETIGGYLEIADDVLQFINIRRALKGLPPLGQRNNPINKTKASMSLDDVGPIAEDYKKTFEAWKKTSITWEDTIKIFENLDFQKQIEINEKLRKKLGLENESRKNLGLEDDPNATPEPVPSEIPVPTKPRRRGR